VVSHHHLVFHQRVLNPHGNVDYVQLKLLGVLFPFSCILFFVYIQLREQSMRRKQQDKDFNDKKFNLTIRDALDEKETDDNLLNINRPPAIDYDLNEYPDQRTYSDRYNPYMYSNTSANSHYNNHHRMKHNDSLPINDRRPRHSDDFADNNRNRKDKSSTKDK
jgi:hypothetical protein